jgi:broad specificity phosphatase PhoE
VATARHLTDALVTVVRGLREVARARFEPDYDALVQRLVANPAVAPAQGWESAEAATTRFSAALHEILESARTDVVVVTHGLVMSLWMAAVAGEPMCLDAWRALEFPDVRVLSAAEVSAWALGQPGPFRLSRCRSTGHAAPAPRPAARGPCSNRFGGRAPGCNEAWE